MIKAGQLDRTFSIIQRLAPASAISDSQITSDNATTYTTILTGWCKVSEVSGNESQQASRTETQRTRLFTMRFSSLVESEHLVLYDTKRYAIRNIQELGRREGLEITATETA